MKEPLRFLIRSTYGKYPISGALLTAGFVDALIGGVNDRPSLFTFGLGLVGIALTLRWIRWQRLPVPSPRPYYALKAQDDRPALPVLRGKKHR